MRALIRSSILAGGVMVLLGVLAPKSWAKPVGPVYTASNNSKVNLKQTVTVDKTNDVKGYAGDPSHPWHTYPPNLLVKAYRTVSNFQAEILRYYYKWSVSRGIACGGPMFPSGAAQLPDSESPFRKDDDGNIVGYKPGIIPSMDEGSTDTAYDPGSPDLIVSFANHEDTAPNKDMCLNWYQGPWVTCTRPSGWTDGKVAVYFANARIAAAYRVGKAMDPFSTSQMGRNTTDNRFLERRVGPAFDVNIIQPQSCCLSWHVLEACLGTSPFAGGVIGEHGNGTSPDLGWTAVTGHSAVPTCSGTGWSGGVEFKTYYVHTVGSSPCGSTMRAAIAIVTATLSALRVKGADRVSMVGDALQKAIGLAEGHDASTSVCTLEKTLDPQFLGPPNVTWNSTEHTDKPGCPSILTGN